MKSPANLQQDLDDLRARNSELLHENRTLKAENANYELRIAQLLQERGEPLTDTDLPLKPDC